MNLGVILSIGESFKDLEEKGQLKRLVNYNIKKYSKTFEKVYIFTYKNEQGYKLPKNCLLITNDKNIHRYLYALALPIMKRQYVRDCQILRGLQLTGGIPALVAKLIYGKKYIINYGYDYANFAKIEGKKLHSLLYKFMEKPILTLANKVIITSREFKESLPCSTAKIAYIPNGVDTDLFSPKFRISKKRQLKIIYIGRLEKQKNLSTLIKAISQTKNPIKLTFYGQGSQKSQLLKLAKQLKVDLKIKPPIDYQKVPKALKEADIFVLPSKEEGHPKALIEAMAVGLAVVGANVKGIRQLINHGQTGILTDTSASQISKAIDSLKDAETRSKLGQAARQFIKENFDIKGLLNREIALLIKTANEK